MRGMASAVEWIQAAPPGRHPIQFDAVEAGTSAKGESHLKISGSISDGPFKGGSFFHYIGTDGGTKYGAMGKKHLRSLGVPVDSDADIPDAVIAAKLQGLRLFAECGNEQRMKPIAEGSKELAPQFELDPKTGQKVAVMNLSIIGYVREPGARIDFGQPGQQLAPQGQPVYNGQPGAGYVPPQTMGYAQPGFVPPGQGFAPPGFVPPGAPGGQPNYVPQVAPPGWGTPPNGAQVQGGPGIPPGFPPQAGAPRVG